MSNHFKPEIDRAMAVVMPVWEQAQAQEEKKYSALTRFERIKFALGKLWANKRLAFVLSAVFTFLTFGSISSWEMLFVMYNNGTLPLFVTLTTLFTSVNWIICYFAHHRLWDLVLSTNYVASLYLMVWCIGGGGGPFLLLFTVFCVIIGGLQVTTTLNEGRASFGEYVGAYADDVLRWANTGS